MTLQFLFWLILQKMVIDFPAITNVIHAGRVSCKFISSCMRISNNVFRWRHDHSLRGLIEEKHRGKTKTCWVTCTVLPRQHYDVIDSRKTASSWERWQSGKTWTSLPPWDSLALLEEQRENSGCRRSLKTSASPRSPTPKSARSTSGEFPAGNGNALI